RDMARETQQAASLQGRISLRGKDLAERENNQEARSPISGKRRLHFVSALVSACSIRLSSQFREMAISLTSKYRARSSIFFSRKDSDLPCARISRLFSTAATSVSDPVRMRSEFSLNRSFQSAALMHSPEER